MSIFGLLLGCAEHVDTRNSSQLSNQRKLSCILSTEIKPQNKAKAANTQQTMQYW